MLRQAIIFAAGLCLTVSAAFAQSAPASEAEALRRELAELQETLKQAQQALAEAKEDLAALEQQKLGAIPGSADQLDEWRDERQRLAREQRMLLHERQRLDTTRESLHRTMRAEARRMENEPLVAPAAPQHAAPGTVVGSTPSRSYIYQYGPLGPTTSYGGGYYVPPAFGHYGFGLGYPFFIHSFPHHGHHDHHDHHRHRHHRGHDDGFFFGGGGVGATRDYFPSSGTFSPWRPANPSRSDVYRPANPGAGFWGGGGVPGSAIPGAKR